jgi:hypothetical protein
MLCLHCILHNMRKCQLAISYDGVTIEITRFPFNMPCTEMKFAFYLRCHGKLLLFLSKEQHDCATVLSFVLE